MKHLIIFTIASLMTIITAIGVAIYQGMATPLIATMIILWLALHATIHIVLYAFLKSIRKVELAAKRGEAIIYSE